jgi:allophanate hydrolase
MDTITPQYMEIAVAGLHLSGQPLNHQLTSLGSRLKRSCTTSAEYKMYLVKDARGEKPGLIRLSNGKGSAFELEIWEVPLENAGKFIAMIPQPLGIGTLNLHDGTQVKGFICEPCVMEQSEDISRFSGWREYVRAKEIE